MFLLPVPGRGEQRYSSGTVVESIGREQIPVRQPRPNLSEYVAGAHREAGKHKRADGAFASRVSDLLVNTDLGARVRQNLVIPQVHDPDLRNACRA